MALPAGELTLGDKQAVNRALLASGATIAEMNTVRKHLSGIKGGRLAAAAQPARIVTLVISDIPGDDAAAIASGPTLADTSTREDALGIIARHAMDLPAHVRGWLMTGAETPKPGTIQGAVRIIAAPSMALAAAADAARLEGITPVILGDALEGESRELGIVMAGIAKSVKWHGLPIAPPAVLLSGGETTVSIGEGPFGRGGRNTEFLLGFAVAIASDDRVWAIAGDTDGIDGTENAAGAIVAPDTLACARSAGLDARRHLQTHDSYSFFDAIGDLVRTGPTLTNVNDFRAILIAAGPPVS
jgi:hydroxypyruvate reductase